MKKKRLSKKRLRFEALEGRQMLSAVTVLPAGGGIVAEAASAPAGHYLSTSAGTGSQSTSASSSTSYNWGGYAVAGATGSVSLVTGSWVVPKVSGSGNTYSALWVGIDGNTSSTVEQLGTSQDVNNGVPTYSAWWEMYPSGMTNITKTTTPTGTATKTPFTVAPGDTITASVQYVTSSNSFVLTMTDGSEFFTTTQAFASPGRHQSAPVALRSSAEWIVEAPSNGFSILPLADFAPTTFSQAYATIGPTTGPIDDWAYTSINIISNSGATIETTGGLGADTPSVTNPSVLPVTNPSIQTSSFTVTYDVPTPVTPPPPGHHGGGGFGWLGGWGWGWSTKAASQITIGLGDQATDSADSLAANDALKAKDGIFASADWLALQAARV
jgi:hypothetical protein